MTNDQVERNSAPAGEMPEYPDLLTNAPGAAGMLNPMISKIDYDKLLAYALRLARDAVMWQWAKPILSGDDEALANSRTMALAAGLMRGESVETIISGLISADAAIKEQKNGK